MSHSGGGTHSKPETLEARPLETSENLRSGTIAALSDLFFLCASVSLRSINA